MYKSVRVCTIKVSVSTRLHNGAICAVQCTAVILVFEMGCSRFGEDYLLVSNAIRNVFAGTLHYTILYTYPSRQSKASQKHTHTPHICTTTAEHYIQLQALRIPKCKAFKRTKQCAIKQCVCGGGGECFAFINLQMEATSYS